MIDAARARELRARAASARAQGEALLREAHELDEIADGLEAPTPHARRRPRAPEPPIPGADRVTALDAARARRALEGR